tara:strand:- start:6369 stop:7085 length:717 start_codon:yes stop_codon:yes gene_type:complete
MKTLLLDGDILIYQAAAAVEQEIDWGDDLWTLHGDAREARNLLDEEVAKLMHRLKGRAVLFALSDPRHNWRMDILSTYKSNRKGKRKPVVYRALRSHVEKHYNTACFSQLEADDVLGINAGEDTIIVSDDKDLMTIPGHLYRPLADEEMEITEEQADRYHLIQTLTGDRVDGYMGCPGIGPKTAEKVLKEGTWDEVVLAYEKAGLSEEVALTQARVARILRTGEWNPMTEEVMLWNPT